MIPDEVARDSLLGAKRTALVNAAANKLALVGMIAFDRELGNFMITDLGRIAAKYYIRYKSIEIFNKVLKPKMTEADVIAMLCMSTEVRTMFRSCGTSLRPGQHSSTRYNFARTK